MFLCDFFYIICVFFVLGFVFSVLAKRLAAKRIVEMTYFVSSGA